MYLIKFFEKCVDLKLFENLVVSFLRSLCLKNAVGLKTRLIPHTCVVLIGKSNSIKDRFCN